jgi:hypothetical protein
MLDAIERLGLDTRAARAEPGHGEDRRSDRRAAADASADGLDRAGDAGPRRGPAAPRPHAHTIETLGAGLTGHGQLLDRLLVSLDHLDENVAALRAAVQPLGRIAERLPGASRR